MNLPQYQLQELNNTAKLKEIAEKYNIYYTIHLEEELDTCSFNEKVREAWIKSVLEVIKIAKKVNIKLLNMHLNTGIYFTLPSKKVFLYKEYEEIYLEKIKEFRDICDKELKNTDIIVSIENTNGYLDFQKRAIDELLQSKNFALTWDIGHSHSFHKDDEEYILNYCSKLVHMHLHDAEGSRTHLELGTGEIDIESKINIAKEYNCRCVIETKTLNSLVNSVKWLHNKFI
jgi:sugar phosphate isomerase/epimerase